MIGNPYPQHQNVQEWNDFVNEVRNVLAKTERSMEELKQRVLAGEGEYDFPDATDEEKGMVKLYQTIGDNEDGAISQAGIKTIISELFATDEEIRSLLNRILPPQGQS